MCLYSDTYTIVQHRFTRGNCRYERRASRRGRRPLRELLHSHRPAHRSQYPRAVPAATQGLYPQPLSWYSFTDPGGMVGWVGLRRGIVRTVLPQDCYVMTFVVDERRTHYLSITSPTSLISTCSANKNWLLWPAVPSPITHFKHWACGNAYVGADNTAILPQVDGV